MDALHVLTALSRAAPGLVGGHPDAATLADELDIPDHAVCYDLMEPVLAAGWARVTNARSSEWDQWSVTVMGRRALAKSATK